MLSRNRSPNRRNISKRDKLNHHIRHKRMFSRPARHNSRNVRNSRPLRGNSSVDGLSRVAAGRGMPHSNRIVLKTGEASIAPGLNVEVTADTTFHKTVSTSVSEAGIPFG